MFRATFEIAFAKAVITFVLNFICLCIVVFFVCVSNNTWKEKRFAQDVQDCPRPYRQPATVFRCEDFLLRAMYFLTTSLYVFHQVLWRFLCAI